MGEIYGLYCVCKNCECQREWVRYVGQTTLGAAKRFKSHKYAVTGNSRPELKSLPVYRWIEKHGPENIRFKVLEVVSNVQNLDEAERSWIERLETYGTKFGLNITPGGVGSRGYKHTEAAKQRMRKNFESRERRMKSSRPGESHHLATFTEEEVRDIKSRLWSGETATSIAKGRGVPVHRIQQINVDKSWRHVPWPIGPRVRPRYRSVLSQEDQRNALELRKTGLSLQKVADRFGVSVSVIVRLERRK